MHTIETLTAMRPKNERDISKAIELLNALVHPGTRSILEFFHEYREGTYVDLLVHCQEVQLDRNLQFLVKAGILIQRETYAGTKYRTNRIKLFRVRKAALALTTNKPDILEVLRKIEIGANL